MAFAPLDPKIRAAVERRLRDRATTPEICAELPVSPATVRRIALALGAERRPGRPPSRAQRVEQIAALRVSNDVSSIAYITGLAEGTVKKYLSDGKRKKKRVT